MLYLIGGAFAGDICTTGYRLRVRVWLMGTQTQTRAQEGGELEGEGAHGLHLLKRCFDKQVNY